MTEKKKQVRDVFKKIFAKREKVDQEIKLQFGDLVKIINKNKPDEWVKLTVDMDGVLQIRKWK